MLRRAQIVGFFLLLIALVAGTSLLAQAGDDEGASEQEITTTTEAGPSTSLSSTPTSTTVPQASTTVLPPAGPTTEPATTSTEIPSTSRTAPQSSTTSSVAPTSTTELATTSTIETTTTETQPTTTQATTTTIETTTTETQPTTTEATTTTTEAQPTTVEVSGEAGLRLGDEVRPGPNLLRLNIFDQASDERLQSIVYTGQTNTGEFSAELRTDLTYRIDVIVCCNAPTVTLSFRDLQFSEDTELDLTVAAVEVVFEVINEAGDPVPDAAIVIPTASGSNGKATWTARVYATPTDENGETRTVLPIGTSSDDERLPTLELADGVKTTFQFTVLGGESTDNPDGPDDPSDPVSTTTVPTTITEPTITEPATTEPTTTEPETTTSEPDTPTTEPATTEPTTTAAPTTEATTTSLDPTSTTESTLLVLLEDAEDSTTSVAEPDPTTTADSTVSEPITTTAPITTSAPGPDPVTTIDSQPQETTEPPESTTVPTESTTSEPGSNPQTTTTTPTEPPSTTEPTGPGTTIDAANPDPIDPTPAGAHTVRITLIAPTSVKLSGKAGLEILGDLTPGSHSLRINFYRSGTDELGSQVTYTGEDNDGSYETHLIAGAAYRAEVIVCCEGPTVRLVFDDLVFPETTTRDFLVPAAKFDIKVVGSEGDIIHDVTVAFDELQGTSTAGSIPWYASGRPSFDSTTDRFPVVLPIGAVNNPDQPDEPAEASDPTEASEEIAATTIIIGEADPVAFTIPAITFNTNGLTIEVSEDADSTSTDPSLTRPWVTPSLSVEPNEAGWINQEAEIAWTVSDPEPSVGLPETDLAPTPVDKEGAHTYWSDEACDLEQNCSKGSLEVSLDTKAPSVEIDGLSRDHDEDVVLHTEPTLTCSAEDSGSGLDGECTIETRVVSSEPRQDETPEAEADDDDTQPGTTGPATTLPEATQTDGADTTEPDTTEPDTTEPVTTEPDTTEPVTTEPDTTQPDTTQPDTTAPEEADVGGPEVFVTTYEVTATATDIAGNVTTETETYRMESEEQVEVPSTTTTTAPTSPTTETTVSTTTTLPETTTTENGSTTVSETPATATTIAEDESTTMPETTTPPETTTSEATVPETTTPETTTTPEPTVPEVTAPETPASLTQAALVQTASRARANSSTMSSASSQPTEILIRLSRHGWG